MGGGGMGKSGSSDSASSSPSVYQEALAQMAQEQYQNTEPLRQQWIDQNMQMASGDYDPTKLPAYKPLYSQQRSAIEDQYGVAKENILGSIPQGGGLVDALSQLEMSRAEDVSGASWGTAGNIIQDMINKSYGTAWGVPGETFNAYGGLASTQAQKESSQMQAQASRYGSEMSILQKMTPSSPQCCFIFLAANGGVLIDVARRYRDEHMTDRNRRGYYRLADVLVPRMQNSTIWKRLVQTVMVDPMIAYGRHVYRGSRWGALFAPVTAAWLLAFDFLGIRKSYTRKVSGEVV